MIRCVPPALALALGGLLAAGCGGAGAQFRQTRGGYLGIDISQKSRWRVGGNLRNPAAAADGKLTTAASARASAPEPTLILDLGRPCVFQTVVIDHARWEHAFPGRVHVAVSADGRTYRPIYVGPGTRRVTILSLRGAVLARYLRLRGAGVGPAGWHVAEVFLQ